VADRSVDPSDVLKYKFCGEYTRSGEYYQAGWPALRPSWLDGDVTQYVIVDVTSPSTCTNNQCASCSIRQAAPNDAGRTFCSPTRLLSLHLWASSRLQSGADIRTNERVQLLLRATLRCADKGEARDEMTSELQ